MRAEELHQPTGRVLVVVCDKGDEPVTAIGDALRRHDLRAGRVTAVGGFREAEVGWFDREQGDYRHIPVREQVEVLSLVGDVAARDGEPALHVHAVLGRSDGSTVGGHLLWARVWPTLEVIVTEVTPELAKRVDPETGLALIAGPGR
ncbi:MULTISPECIES: PPC domain-containing DNA-binding protein [unclassified Micromonospora]|uniref:PPC domain-containing DNA-binding protein n=1 Tax=unclassified Micromonospora TaxID=2617518 RepID=UPI001C210B78|nr:MULTISPECIES: PPC domain-containing DNA-binding protein [unclassified Micromonospora]MBU8861712.1 DNA-binding protein [Micromonospora sp. WMMB482]MDM4781285.1 DNA-binding protein [Micromonospora sp. b486]